MAINGKIMGFDLLPKNKGAKIFYTDNVIEAGESTYKEYSVKVERQPSENLETILRTLVGHAIYVLGLSNGNLGEKEFKSRKVVDMPVFKDFKFAGFKIAGDGEDEQLIVKMKLKNINDEEVAISSGKIGVADGTYAYEELLSSDLDQVITEVKSFIEGTNYYVQAKIEFPVEANNEDEEL